MVGLGACQTRPTLFLPARGGGCRGRGGGGGKSAISYLIRMSEGIVWEKS